VWETSAQVSADNTFRHMSRGAGEMRSTASFWRMRWTETIVRDPIFLLTYKNFIRGRIKHCTGQVLGPSLVCSLQYCQEKIINSMCMGLRDRTLFAALFVRMYDLSYNFE
jgi:hypothetical protein